MVKGRWMVPITKCKVDGCNFVASDHPHFTSFCCGCCRRVWEGTGAGLAYRHGPRCTGSVYVEEIPALKDLEVPSGDEDDDMKGLTDVEDENDAQGSLGALNSGYVCEL